MNWGLLAVNSTTTATFTNAFSTAVYSLSIAPQSVSLVGANTPYIAVINTTVAQIRSVATSNPATFNVSFMAIGV